MSDATAFVPNTHTGPVWERARALVTQPARDDAPWEVVREEMAVRELIHRYAYAWDQSDIDGLLRLFTDDGVIHEAEGTTAGPAALRARYERQVAATAHRFHLFTNVIVRVADDLRSATASSYFHVLLQKVGQAPRALGGLIVDDAVKQDGAWKFRTRSITIDISYAPASGG